MKKLILLAIALSLCPTNIFSQDTIDTTITNIAVDTLFNTIYYKDGSFSTHDSFQSVCNITFGVDKGEKYLLVECHISTNGDEENIINAELIDRIEKKDGEIVSGDKVRKTFRMISIIGTSTIYILAGGIIISLVLLA